jgi:hypothetical protein
MHGGSVVASVSSMLYQMIPFLGDIGVDVGWLLGASCVADCVPLVVLVVACSLNFCCLCDMTPKWHFCAKE